MTVAGYPRQAARSGLPRPERPERVALDHEQGGAPTTRRWIIAAAFAVVPVVAGPGVGTAAAAPLPGSVAAIGDSITQAYDVCCWYGNHPANSWSTGGAGWDGVSSGKSQVSKLDYFHPSLSGQAALASITWTASWWSTL